MRYLIEPAKIEIGHLGRILKRDAILNLDRDTNISATYIEIAESPPIFASNITGIHNILLDTSKPLFPNLVIQSVIFGNTQ